MAQSYLTEAIPKKPEPGTKAVNIAAAIVDRIFIYFFALILLFCLYAIYDALMVYREAEVPVEVRRFTSKTENDKTSEVDFTALKNINDEIIAWIQIDDTDVDFPVTYTDNNNFYLSHSYTKDYSLAGSIFLDARNAADFSDDYSVIYGHNMNGEMMFGSLFNFADTDYFNSHQNGRLLTPDAKHELKVIAALKTDRADGKIYSIQTLRKEHNAQILDYLKQFAIQTRIDDTDYQKQIVALSTCYDKDGGRMVIFATYGELPVTEPTSATAEAPAEN